MLLKNNWHFWEFFWTKRSFTKLFEPPTLKIFSNSPQYFWPCPSKIAILFYPDNFLLPTRVFDTRRCPDMSSSRCPTWSLPDTCRRTGRSWCSNRGCSPRCCPGRGRPRCRWGRPRIKPFRTNSKLKQNNLIMDLLCYLKITKQRNKFVSLEPTSILWTYFTY